MGDSNVNPATTTTTAEADPASAPPAVNPVVTLEGLCPKQIVTDLNELRRSGMFCDFRFKVGGEIFQAHKIMLASFSPYFSEVFNENSDSFELEDMTADIFGMIVDYAYSCSIAPTADKMVPLLLASIRLKKLLTSVRHCDTVPVIVLQMILYFFTYHYVYTYATPLVEVCAEYLGENTNGDNFVQMKDLAAELSCAELAAHVNNYVRKHFSELCQQDTFLNLKPEHIIDIIKDDDLEIESEEIVFDAVIRWVKHKEERISLLSKVLINVRLALLSPDFLRKCEMEEVIRITPVCERWIDRVLLYKLMEGFEEPLEAFTKPPRGSGVIEGILVVSKRSLFSCTIDHGKSSILKCSLSSESRPLPLQGACGIVGNQVHLLLSNTYYEVFKYDSSYDHWKFIFSCQPYSVFPKGFVESEGRVYFSLTESSSGSSTVVRYDLELQKWMFMASIPYSIYSCYLIEVDKLVYAMGGSTRLHKSGFIYNKFNSRMLRYNPQTNSWSELAQLPTRLYSKEQLLCCGFGRRIYVIDGTENQSSGLRSTLYVYDVATNTWNGVPLNKVYLRPAALMILNGKLTFIDGERFPYLSIETFSPATNSWEVQPKVKLDGMSSESDFYIVQLPVKLSRRTPKADPVDTA